MTHAQQIALVHHCRLAVETAHPRFATLINGGFASLVLTLNSGYE